MFCINMKQGRGMFAQIRLNYHSGKCITKLLTFPNQNPIAYCQDNPLPKQVTVLNHVFTD